MTPEVPESSPQVFDRGGTFTITLGRINKKVSLRFPTDDQVIKRESLTRTFFRKGNSIPEIEGQEGADADLFSQLIVGGDDIPDESKSRVLGNLLKSSVASAPERSSTGYRIEIDVTGGLKVFHELREPSEKEIRKYGRASFSLGEVRFGRQEAKTYLREVGAFYDKLFSLAEGYSANDTASIPISHKAAAVNAMLQKIREEEEADEVDPAGNFPG